MPYINFVTPSAFPIFYDGYGNQVWSTPSGIAPGWYPTLDRATSQPFQYKGQYGYYTDGASGLIYCINRYYDPNTGRWTQRDPTGLDGGVNVYEYCEGDPVGMADPDGLDSYAIISGDTSFPAYFMHPVYHRMAISLRNHHQTVSVYDGPQRSKVDSIMTSSVEHVHFWGHGNKGMLFFGFPNNDHLDTNDILRYARIRSSKGLPRMKSIDIDECLVLADEGLINALLKIAEKVSGYEGWTLGESTYSPGIKRTYSKPFAHRPLIIRNDGPYNYQYYRGAMKMLHDWQMFEHPDQ